MHPELHPAWPTDKLQHDTSNPRKYLDAVRDRELAESVALYGVQVPLICYQTPQQPMIADGQRRWLAAKEAGQQTVPIYLLPQRPDEGDLLTLQLTINEHRSQLNVVDEYEAYLRLMELRGWSQAQLATGLALRPAEITSVMALGKLSAAQRQLVRERQLSRSSAYAVARLPVAERDECLKQAVAGQLKRDQLNAKARRRTKTDERKSQRIVCSLREAEVTVKAAAGLNLTSLIDLLDELLRLCRKARTDGLDIQTAVRVFRDRARAQSTT
jgi:ParB family chromosome partitioning protein